MKWIICIVKSLLPLAIAVLGIWKIIVSEESGIAKQLGIGIVVLMCFGAIAAIVYNTIKELSKKQDGSSKQRPSKGRGVSLEKLPVTDTELFGRDDELKLLDDAWEGDCNIITFVAWGGVGKTALVNEWLGRMGDGKWGGAKRVYGWSFYSQGTKEQGQASGDVFINDALKWFGDEETAESKETALNKGRRLAELVREEKTLFVLDGLEPLQYPPGPMGGQLKDQGVMALLKGLARDNNGLCVVTTREAVKDIAGLGHGVEEINLENLTEEAGAEVLKNRGVNGTEEELKQASAEFGNHALALNLLGEYLAVVHEGEIRKRDLVPHLTDDKKQGGHARRVMESYEIWLEGKAELDILYLLGLFDRPAEAGAIDVLRGEPVIAGLTENLAKLDEAKWMFATKRLQEVGLLAKSDGEEDGFDCHPLVREHFGEKLKAKNPDAWEEAHGRLYEYYKSVPEKKQPDTLEEMEPLFKAVYHGCQAGKHQETFYDVYGKRISRGDEYYITHKLGALGSHLGVVSCFFEKQWSEPTEGLEEQDKALVLNMAGFSLRAIGRLAEAVDATEAGMNLYVRQKNWKEAALNAGNLSEMNLALGEVEKAAKYGEKSVEHADRSKDKFERMVDRTALADAFFQAGKIDKARKLFEEAEQMQAERQPRYPKLCSMRGYHYCDLLLSEGKNEEVLERGRQILELAQWSSTLLLDLGVGKLAVGRALAAMAAEGKGDLAEAEKQLDEAVDGLRKAGHEDHIPRGLLARGECYRLQGEYGKAWGELEEVKEIAERGGMRLWLADYHLEALELCIAEGNKKREAKEHYEAGRELIDETGYHRRDAALKAIMNYE